MTRQRRVRDSCCVVDQHCLAPAGVDDGASVRLGACFHCGEPVCRMCSSRRTLPHFGVRRVCNNCQEQLDGHGRRVLLRIAMQSGYSRSQAAHIVRQRYPPG